MLGAIRGAHPERKRVLTDVLDLATYALPLRLSGWKLPEEPPGSTMVTMQTSMLKTALAEAARAAARRRSTRPVDRLPRTASMADYVALHGLFRNLSEVPAAGSWGASAM